MRLNFCYTACDPNQTGPFLTPGEEGECMTVIVCVDDQGGMLFGGRRQSQDRLVREDILREAAGRRLWMNEFSRRQFGRDETDSIVTDENFLSRARPGDFCFVENVSLKPFVGRMNRVIVYRWNRVYPADRFLDLPLEDPVWKQTRREEFPGYSHPKITKEVYEG